MARCASETDPSLSEAQHFARLAEQNPDLFRNAKARPGSVDVDPDDDDPDVDETDDDPEDDDPTDDIGTPPFEGASGDGRGKSPGGPYDNSGSNVRQYPKELIGATEASYDPNKRSASATRKAAGGETVWRTAVAKRFAKFLSKHPGGTPEEACSMRSLAAGQARV